MKMPNTCGAPRILITLASRGGCHRARGIYIHGTPEESRLGQPVSWGCIRRRARAIAQLFAFIQIANLSLAATCFKNRPSPQSLAFDEHTVSSIVADASSPSKLRLVPNFAAIPCTFSDIRWSVGISGWNAPGMRLAWPSPSTNNYSIANTTTSILERRCDTAQILFPKNCSGAVKYMAKEMGYPLPDLSANGIIDYLDNDKTWTAVDENEAQRNADANRLVIAGKKAVGHGHVVIVLPGGKVKSGGYPYIDKTGKKQTTPNKGDYPKSFSTSMGSWPGAVSAGERSTFDAWGSASGYAGVKYWLAPRP